MALIKLTDQAQFDLTFVRLMFDPRKKAFRDKP